MVYYIDEHKLTRIMDCWALIPARGGSKGIPRKNIKHMNNIPLICYTIRQAKQSKHIQRVIVSTDDEEIANVALSEGAEVPFIRPEAISRDRSTDLECSNMQYNVVVVLHGGYIYGAHIQPEELKILIWHMKW